MGLIWARIPLAAIISPADARVIKAWTRETC